VQAEFGKVVSSNAQATRDGLPTIRLPLSCESGAEHPTVGRRRSARPQPITILDPFGRQLPDGGRSLTRPPQLMPRGGPQGGRRSRETTECLLESDTSIEQLTALMRISAPLIHRQMQMPIQVEEVGMVTSPSLDPLQYPGER